MSCVIDSVTYTEIVCETVCASSPSMCFVGRMTATVRVGTMMAECLDPSCNFIADELKTATVTNISPDTVSAGKK